MIRNRQLAGLLAILVLAACEAQEAEQDPGQAESQIEAEQEASSGTAEAAGGAIQLAPIDHSGITGSVEADRGDDEVSVTVSVEGLEAGAEYQAHVHDGRCAAGGPVRIPMGDLERGDEGQGTFRISVRAANLPGDEPVFVQVHGPDGAAVACADLPTEDGDGATIMDPDSLDA